MRRAFGRFDPGVLRTLLAYELRMLVRDRRTILIAVVAPLLLFPAIILLMRMVGEREQERLAATTFRYAIVGSEALLARSLVAEALALPPDTAGGDTAAIRFEAAAAVAADSLLRAGTLHVVVEALSVAEYAARRDSIEAAADEGATRRAVRRSAPNVPALRLLYRANSQRSEVAADRLEQRLQRVREARREAALAAGGFPVPSTEIARLDAANIASARKEGGAALGLFLTPMLVMLILSGGSIVAVDAIAGEKERGTLESLLTTAATRTEIVTSKQLAVIAVGVAITVINIANLILYLMVGLIDVPENFAAALTISGLAALLILLLPLAVLISSALLLLSGYAKSYKEYQLYFFPVLVVFLLPSCAAVLPGLELRSVVAVIPLANVSVAVREVLVGRYDWPFLALTFVSTAAAALWLTRLTSRTLSTERLITAAELDRADLAGGPILFQRRVLRWFGVMWAVLLVASLWIGQALDIRGQVAVNLLGVFLGGTVLMLRRYRLSLRDALALRAPPPAAWLAVLIGAPSGLLTGIGLTRALDALFPVPEQVAEAFGQFLLPEGISILQVVVFLAVLPGICEELAFRGVLLHGLRRRFQPVALAVVVGLIFGIFHFTLFRILPTAYLGMLLAGIVLLTGSIYPAMVWHALNNAVVLVPAYYGWTPDEAAFPMWAHGTGVVGLAIAALILWHWRRPYPGLRWPRATPQQQAQPAV
ncbi:MAG: ABC transporter permease subunit [Longimicrobiales bacterium]